MGASHLIPLVSISESCSLTPPIGARYPFGTTYRVRLNTLLTPAEWASVPVTSCFKLTLPTAISLGGDAMRSRRPMQPEQHSDWFGNVPTNVDNRHSARQPLTKFVHWRQLTATRSHSYGRIGDDSPRSLIVSQPRK